MTATTPPGALDASAAGSPADTKSARRWPPRWWRRFRQLPRTLQWGAYAVVALVLVLVAVSIVGVTVVRRSFPQTTGTLEVEGLQGEVEVVRDAAGVPQIYADTTDDLMFAQGYVHAQERFFEMDVRRHATAGRLAEMFGEAALETDLYVRTMGWRRVAEEELPLLDPDTRAALDSYARGVNAYLDGRPNGAIALEYTVLDAGGLDYAPEPWNAVDSLAWLKAMAWDLRGNMHDEIARVLSADAVGAERAAQLFPAYDAEAFAPIVQQGAVVDGVFEQDADAPGTRLPRRPAPFASDDALRALGDVHRGLERMPAWLGRGEGLGSNSWVVSGEFTDTGAPLLANDPHLGVSLPSVWMQVGLHCRSVSSTCPFDVAGFSFSGVPGVIIGHNASIAWGFTNLGPDVTDLYVERIQGDTWLHGRRYRKLDQRTETIEVADGDDVTLTVRSTAHGPILSDVDDVLADLATSPSRPRGPGRGRDADEYAVSLAWTALEPSTTADAIFGLNLATDWRSFRAALSDFAAPAQNVVYADVEGHIGYQAPGRIPIRKSGNDGRTPSAGWAPENDWTGQFVPYDGLPTVLDPDEGFVITANQAVIGAEYPYFLTSDWDRGYRSQRIRELLTEKIAEGPVTLADQAEIQLDDLHPLATTLLPYLDAIDIEEAYHRAGQDLLADWDGHQGADSPAAAYFNVVWRNLLARTFDDELPEEARADGGERWIAVVTDLLNEPDSLWWDDVDTEARETRDDILEAALRSARDDLTRLQDLDPQEWSWGRLHELRLASSTLGTSDLSLVLRLFNRGGWEAPGGTAAVNATGWDARDGFQVAWAPSMRMIVSLADFDDSVWINLAGVSGHAFHEHYTDQTDLWVEGARLPWAFSRDAVAGLDGTDTLTLVPPGG